jgi:4-aminobutyrate aminotransferase-like enzyme
MVNNVAVIGHSHPAITSAITKQIQVLNTNSRFIYSLLGKFCEKIISKIPEAFLKKGKLNRVFLVNSGSEATDLALRIARTVVTERRRKGRRRKATTNNPTDGEGEGEGEAHALQRDVICLEGGYHGVTTASDEVSTTLNDNPRALESRAPWIHLAPMPNLFRGRIKHHDRPIEEESEIKIGESYAEFVNTIIDNLNQSGRLPSAFICEPLSGNAGSHST